MASIGNKLTKGQITTFSIGFLGSPDLKYARIVADHIDSVHHQVYVTEDDILGCIRDVIWNLETYDITTIRASIPMWLLGKYISKFTDIRVIMSGEGADELFGGYLYFHDSPSDEDFQKESQRLVDVLHKYDVLRSDRSTAAHGLEMRVPFLDRDFLRYVMNLPENILK